MSEEHIVEEIAAVDAKGDVEVEEISVDSELLGDAELVDVADEEEVVIEPSPYDREGDWYIIHSYAGYENKVGIVTATDGAPIPAGEMAAPAVAGHESFQNPDAFLVNGGCKGLQEQILLSGQYNLNPWFVEVPAFSLE